MQRESAPKGKRLFLLGGFIHIDSVYWRFAFSGRNFATFTIEQSKVSNRCLWVWRSHTIRHNTGLYCALCGFLCRYFHVICIWFDGIVCVSHIGVGFLLFICSIRQCEGLDLWMSNSRSALFLCSYGRLCQYVRLSWAYIGRYSATTINWLNKYGTKWFSYCGAVKQGP